MSWITLLCKQSKRQWWSSFFPIVMLLKVAIHINYSLSSERDVSRGKLCTMFDWTLPMNSADLRLNTFWFVLLHSKQAKLVGLTLFDVSLWHQICFDFRWKRKFFRRFFLLLHNVLFQGHMDILFFTSNWHQFFNLNKSKSGCKNNKETTFLNSVFFFYNTYNLFSRHPL